MGSARRRKSPGNRVTPQAPSIDPANPSRAAGHKAPQRICTRWLNWAAAAAVPQIEALLLVPSNVAGGAPGNTAKSAGTRIKPPPPTIESTNPASSEAPVTTSISMPGLSHPRRYQKRSFDERQGGPASALAPVRNRQAKGLRRAIKKAPTSGAFQVQTRLLERKP